MTLAYKFDEWRKSARSNTAENTACVQARSGRLFTKSASLPQFIPDGPDAQQKTLSVSPEAYATRVSRDSNRNADEVAQSAGRGGGGTLGSSFTGLDLDKLIGNVKEFGRQLPSDETQVCLKLVTELMRQRYSGGIRRDTWTDDLLIGSASSPRYLNVPRARWGRITSWHALASQVPANGTSFVVFGQPGHHNHAIALIDTTEGVRVIDPHSSEDVRVTPVADRIKTGSPALINARVLTVKSNGTISEPGDPLTDRRSDSIIEALTDPSEHRVAGLLSRRRIPRFTRDGLLPRGEFTASWDDVVWRFGTNRHRVWLLDGLQAAATNLRDAGVKYLWLDGSFVTDKELPNDYDGAWDPRGVDLSMIDPILIDHHDLRHGRRRQKEAYRGELLVDYDSSMRRFFQRDRSGARKGIVRLRLRTVPPPATNSRHPHPAIVVHHPHPVFVAHQPPPPRFLHHPHPAVVVHHPRPVFVAHQPPPPLFVHPAHLRGRGGTRGDDPVELRWPVGQPIVVELAKRGTDDDWRQRSLGGAAPSLVREQLPANAVDSVGVVGRAAAPIWLFEKRFFQAGSVGDPNALDQETSAGSSFGYRVDSTGEIVLPDGVRIPATGWREHGLDFLNIDESSRVVVLRADSGWVGLVDNGDILLEGLRQHRRGMELPAYRAHVHNDALHLTPRRGKSIHVGQLQALHGANDLPTRSIEPDVAPVPRVSQGFDWSTPHVEIGPDGLQWTSSKRSSRDSKGKMKPSDKRSCVEVALIK